METELLNIYQSGSEVLIKGSGLAGVVEKTIIGDNLTISYQLIVYAPERHQVQVSSYEVIPITDKTRKQPIGFHAGVDNMNDDCKISGVVKPQEIKILIDEDDRFQGIANDHPEISIEVVTLTSLEIKELEGLEDKDEKKKKTRKKES